MAVLVVFVSAMAVAKESDDGHPDLQGMWVTAIWDTQQLTLVHHEEDTHYSCPELVNRVVAILQAVGANVVDGTGVNCLDAGLSQTLNVTVRRPVEATPENIRRAIDVDGTQRLLAHVRQQTLAGEADLPRFHAAWRTVSLMGLRHPRITNTDCGLLRTLVSQAFPRLDVRIAKNRFQCPRGESSIQPKVVTEALLPLSDGTKSGTYMDASLWSSDRDERERSSDIYPAS